MSVIAGVVLSIIILDDIRGSDIEQRERPLLPQANHHL